MSEPLADPLLLWIAGAAIAATLAIIALGIAVEARRTRRDRW